LEFGALPSHRKNMESAKVFARPAALSVFTLLVIAAPPAPSAAADAHVHGLAALQVAVDGNRLLLEFSSPLDNLVGFEHAPRNDKQTAAVRRMAERLHKPALLFVPTPEALCTPVSVSLESPVIERLLLTAVSAPRLASDRPIAKAQKGDDKAGHEAHAALSSEMVFQCERPEKLSSLEARLFDSFPDVRRLDVQVAGPRKQAAATLTARSRRISW
jgi:hypothetical protein